MSHITDEALLEKHAGPVGEFKAFCVTHGAKHETFDEVNFIDLSLGFFIALGVTGDGGTGDPFYEAFQLSTICRYRLHYWESEWIKP